MTIELERRTLDACYARIMQLDSRGIAAVFIHLTDTQISAVLSMGVRERELPALNETETATIELPALNETETATIEEIQRLLRLTELGPGTCMRVLSALIVRVLDSGKLDRT